MTTTFATLTAEIDAAHDAVWTLTARLMAAETLAEVRRLQAERDAAMERLDRAEEALRKL